MKQTFFNVQTPNSLPWAEYEWELGGLSNEFLSIKKENQFCNASELSIFKEFCTICKKFVC